MPSWKVYCVRCERRVCIVWPVGEEAPGGDGRSFRISDVVTCEHADPWAEDFDFTWAMVGLDPVLRVERRTEEVVGARCREPPDSEWILGPSRASASRARRSNPERSKG